MWLFCCIKPNKISLFAIQGIREFARSLGPDQRKCPLGKIARHLSARRDAMQHQGLIWGCGVDLNVAGFSLASCEDSGVEDCGLPLPQLPRLEQSVGAEQPIQPFIHQPKGREPPPLIATVP